MMFLVTPMWTIQSLALPAPVRALPRSFSQQLALHWLYAIPSGEHTRLVTSGLWLKF